MHTRKPAWPPARIFLQRRTSSWLPSYSDLAETSPFRLPRLFSALPWVILGALQGAKVNLLSFFAGFAHQFPRLIFQDRGGRGDLLELSRRPRNNLLRSQFETGVHQFTFWNTRPKPAYGRQGLDRIIGPGYSFVVFSTTDLLWSKNVTLLTGGSN